MGPNWASRIANHPIVTAITVVATVIALIAGSLQLLGVPSIDSAADAILSHGTPGPVASGYSGASSGTDESSGTTATSGGGSTTQQPRVLNSIQLASALPTLSNVNGIYLADAPTDSPSRGLPSDTWYVDASTMEMPCVGASTSPSDIPAPITTSGQRAWWQPGYGVTDIQTAFEIWQFPTGGAEAALEAVPVQASTCNSRATVSGDVGIGSSSAEVTVDGGTIVFARVHDVLVESAIMDPSTPGVAAERLATQMVVRVRRLYSTAA